MIVLTLESKSEHLTLPIIKEARALQKAGNEIKQNLFEVLN